MVVLLGICVVVLVVMGFSQPVWWLAAGALVYLALRYGRGAAGRGGAQRGGYDEYRARREQRDKWDRRYRRQHRGQRITPDRPVQ
ncbi:hypothetical protein OG897_07865 [Streptomyces sp. NBC_00237]|uniref:hypothetical protein n=1 Tax=Streptomyces sp. NBC_00237 TaxID=2975687 RepID=UPI0022560FDC|nr:hypothetical protein [Streptomyces sp. NBC_00237]MCX5201367.1 hypothetical protein [Streptomyces sp. NBC_00237]